MTVVSPGVAPGVAWFMFVTFRPRSSHEAVAAARLEAAGQALGNCRHEDDSLSADAAAATVAVLFDVTQAREYVLSGSFQDTYSGKDGYLLPVEKYLPWNVVEATFGPEGVRVR